MVWVKGQILRNLIVCSHPGKAVKMRWGRGSLENPCSAFAHLSNLQGSEGVWRISAVPLLTSQTLRAQLWAGNGHQSCTQQMERQGGAAAGSWWFSTGISLLCEAQCSVQGRAVLQPGLCCRSWDPQPRLGELPWHCDMKGQFTPAQLARLHLFISLALLHFVSPNL